MIASTLFREKWLKYGWILRYFRQQWKLMLALALFLLLTVAFQLGTPLLLRAFLDAVSEQAPAGQTTSAPTGSSPYLFYALLYILAAFGLRGVRVGENYLAEWVAWKATNALRIDLVRHCLSLDLSFHLAHTPGELIERIDGDVRVLNNFFSRFVLILVTNSLIVLGVIGILSRIDWRIGVLLACYTTLYVAAIFWLNTKTVVNFVRALETEAKLFGFLEERLGGTEDIRASGATGYVLRQLTVLMRQRLNTQQHAEVIQGLIGIIRMVIAVAGFLTSLAFSASLYQQGEITIGTAYIIFYYMYIVWDPLRDLVYQFSDFQKALAALRRLSALFAIRSTITDGSRETLPAGPFAVCFEDVSFSYPGTGSERRETPALCNVSFRLAAGRTLGLLGQTGSGKSTLARLLFRFYDPQQGQITLNGVDIREATLQALCSRVALVTQNVQLFHGSLRDNITFLDRTIPDAALLDAFQALGLSEWYAGLPEGLETPLHGDSLSAGQAQLVALTRVFLQQPDLIILDEASSRLDPLTEAWVQRALDRLLQGRTAIIIAHRLQTVSLVDNILILEDGQIREFGTRKELARQRDSRYKHLLETDMLARNA